MEQLEKEKNQAYWERNQLVSALSKIFPSHLAKHPESDKEWEDDWRTIVVIYLPADKNREFKDSIGSPVCDYQMTWHIHDHDLPMFDHLQYEEYEWDGHTTEEKYRRLRCLFTKRLEEIKCDLWFDNPDKFAETKGHFHNEEESVWAITGYNIKVDEINQCIDQIRERAKDIDKSQQ
jgi:hypothetical protein